MTMHLPKPIAKPNDRIIFWLKNGRPVKGIVRQKYYDSDTTIPRARELFVVRYEDERRIDRYAIVQISINHPHKCIMDSLVSVFPMENGKVEAIAVVEANLVQLLLNERGDIVWKEKWNRNNQ